MIGAAFPGFLFAAPLFVAIPIVLHLLRRRPPSREPLPTARFLTPDARTLLRLQSRPSDVVLLAVRIAFAMALVGAFAGLTWNGTRSGTVRVILLDAGQDSLSDWEATLEEVRRLALDSSSTTNTDGGSPESVVLAYGLPNGHRIVSLPDLDGLPRGEIPTTAESGLRALRSVVSESRWAQAEVVWVTRRAWRHWTPDAGLLRPELWPGRTMFAAPSTSSVSDAAPSPLSTSPPPAVAAWVFEEALSTPLQAALEALGTRVISGAGDAGRNPDWIFARVVSPTAMEALIDRAREGSSVVLAGRLTNPGVEIPWTLGQSAESEWSTAGGILTYGRDRVIGVDIERQPGAPARGARVVAVFEDASPAAASRTVGLGCVTYLAADLLDPALVESPEYPTLTEALADGCGRTDESAALDQGAVFMLERPDLPLRVEAAGLGKTGKPLTRWLMILALALFALEVGLTRGRSA